ncbi:MAG: enoyl-CoA hydratase/isomerase family protein [Aeromicrobium sp.]|uniref:enoyl-CoA hydratase/isomerase family protein n=1 Tax=Aeromicrobium sp. TaxID=1871063 RepID=UPI0039E41F30
MTATEDLVSYAVTDHVAEITLRRPDAANAFDLPLAQSFQATVEQALADADVHVILLAGEGARFSAGGDLASMVDAPDPQAALAELARIAHLAVKALDAPDGKPVVVAVQGAAAGIGLSFVLGADVVVAARSAKFVTAYTSVGLTPDGGMSWLLPRVVGQRRAAELLLTARPVDAEEAERLGIVSTITDDDPLEVARVEAARLAQRPAEALAQARRLVRSSWSRDLAPHLDDEAETISHMVSTEPTQGLINRFLKR